MYFSNFFSTIVLWTSAIFIACSIPVSWIGADNAINCSSSYFASKQFCQSSERIKVCGVIFVSISFAMLSTIAVSLSFNSSFDIVLLSESSTSTKTWILSLSSGFGSAGCLACCSVPCICCNCCISSGFGGGINAIPIMYLSNFSRTFFWNFSSFVLIVLSFSWTSFGSLEIASASLASG